MRTCPLRIGDLAGTVTTGFRRGRSVAQDARCSGPPGRPSLAGRVAGHGGSSQLTLFRRVASVIVLCRGVSTDETEYR